jgi:tRNA threonylcarbamoyladenosine biosynthesis protein TsaE
MKKTIHNEDEMLAAAVVFSQQLKPGMLITLKGPLGAGKTTFVRGIFRALGYDGKVKSPTYTLVETYDISHQAYCHFDLYRLHDPHELEFMGFRDYLNGENICFIEWPEKAGDLLPQADYSVEVNIIENGRELSVVTSA